MPTLAERCAPIELIVLDVDGVLTDGGIIYGGADLEVKAFHVRDGSGLKFWAAAVKRTAIITGRDSSVVTRRATELGITHLVQGSRDKLAALQSILATTELRPAQVAAMGDDLPDLPVMRSVGLAIAVADACPEARVAAHYVTNAEGGRGAVREALELVMRCQGTWQQMRI
jgi:3-deoxy-D-manno-octulosonate 8-phosphate phosphatase (KDO 8-P phosphatase)